MLHNVEKPISINYILVCAVTWKMSRDAEKRDRETQTRKTRNIQSLRFSFAFPVTVTSL
jgi:hypothetical protein